MLGRERADAPTAPHVRLHEAVDDANGTIRRNDAAGQAMSGVRRHRSNGLLVAVEAQIIGPFFLPPEPVVELLVEADGSFLQLGRSGIVTPDLIGLRHAQQGVEGITLQLA